MVCRQCGTQLSDNEIVCSLCGYKLQNVKTPDYIQKQVMDMLKQESPEKPVEEHLEKPAKARSDQHVSEQQEADARVVKEETEPQERNIESAKPQEPDIRFTGKTDIPQRPDKSLEAEPVQAQETNKKEAKKQIPLKKWIGLGAAAAAVAVIIGIATVSIRVTGDESRNRVYPMAYTEDNEDVLVLLNAKAEKKTVWDWDGICVPSADGSLVAYSADNILYCAGRSLEPVKVDESVSKVYTSVGGDCFAYLKRGDSDTDFYDLYLYDVKRDKRQKISSDVYPYFICLSPNGRRVAYVKDVEIRENDMDSALCLADIDGESVKSVGGGCMPMAVSDDGKSLFYMQAEIKGYQVDKGSLCYYDGNNIVKISTDTENTGYMYINQTVTEMIYDKEGKTYYFSTKQQEPRRIGGSSFIRPGGADATVADYVNLYNVDSLTDSFYIAGNDLVWLNKDGSDTVKVSSDIAGVQVSKDGHGCLYLRGGRLYRIKNFSGSGEPECLFEEEEVLSYAASDDLSSIYFVTAKGRLFCYQDKGRKCISDDMPGSSMTIAYNEQDKSLYFIENDNLYRVKNKGDAPKLVEREVNMVLEGRDGIWYVASDGRDGTIFWINQKQKVKVAQCDGYGFPMISWTSGGWDLPVSLPFAETEMAEGAMDEPAAGEKAEASEEEMIEEEAEAGREYAMPGSDFRYLTMDDLNGLSAVECRIIRNEIYARHGRKFDDAELQVYFNACSWYNGTVAPEDFDDSVLNDYEIANLALIIEYEKLQGYR